MMQSFIELTNKTSRSPIFYLALILLFAIFLRFPGIKYGLPYFYDEDEGHHFNRTMNMVRTGDFNPHYFLKPSLHFYLRVPAIALGFLWEVNKGRAHEVKDVITKNKFGLAGYAFTASHPGIVKWARGVSLLFGLALIVLSYNIVIYLTKDRLSGLLAALLMAVAPALVQNSTIVGVDTITAFFTLLTVHEAVRLTRDQKFLFPRVFGYIALLAGLTISTKYNCFPIIVVPFLITFYYSPKQKLLQNLFLVLLAITFGFLIGTPYCIKEFPLFLNHIAYEIWHYGIAGHVGHEAEPGIAQAMHYLGWLGSFGVGVLPLLCGFFGVFFGVFFSVFYLNRKNKFEAVLLVIYPFLFFCYMCSQKANFERNMISIIPFIVCVTAIFFNSAKSAIHNHPSYKASVLKPCIVFAFLTLSLQQTITALKLRSDLNSHTDTRNIAEETIRSEISKGRKIAISGELQFSPYLYKLSGVQVFSEKEGLSPVLNGEAKNNFDLVVSKKDFGLNTIKQFDGERNEQRIVNNPQIYFGKH